MGRKKLDGDYRTRYEEKHPNRTHGERGKARTKKTHGFFVAWDGEGRNVGEPDDDGYQPHEMNCFAYSNSDSSIAGGLYEQRRLTTTELFNCIGEGVSKAGKLAVHVSFSFTYDVTHLLFDVDREQCIHSLSDQWKKLSDYGRYGHYIFKYRPRKLFYLAQLRDAAKPYTRDARGAWHLDLVWSVTIWDVFGFFQCGFYSALKQWGVGSKEELQIIADGKEGRGEFATWEEQDILAYNNLELRLLCNLMASVKQAFQSQDLHLTRWDGAGAAASALYQKELPKGYFRSITLPEAVSEAAYYAYAGGRAELIRQGSTTDTLYKYDINSAYPYAMMNIPDLTTGEWVYVRQPITIDNFALYRITWNYPSGAPCYPFFFRDYNGNIFFPPRGENWLFGVEINAAGKQHITIHEGYIFVPGNEYKPFAFIQKYYNERQLIKERKKAGTALPSDNGVSLAIKLAVNSLYGKTIQKVGASYDENGSVRLPPYYNIVIGSYITAATRAALYTRGAVEGAATILFATDGIISSTRLSATGIGAGIGQWEYSTADGGIFLGSGLYWLNEGGRWVEKSRGIDRSFQASDERRNAVVAGWKEGRETVSFPLRRFLGSKYSSVTEERWKRRGMWITTEKDVQLYNSSNKREATPKSVELWNKIYLTGVYSPDYQQSIDMRSYPRSAPEPSEDSEETEE